MHGDSTLPEYLDEVLARRLTEAHVSLRHRLESRLTWRSAENPFWEVILALLMSTRHTFMAGKVLISDERIEQFGFAFVAQATILARSLLEGLGNVTAICASPVRRARLLGIDSYKARRAAVDLARAAPWAETASWRSWLTTEQDHVDALGRSLSLTPPAIAQYRQLRSWPTIANLLTSADSDALPYVDGTAKDVLQELHDCWYAEQSRVAHQKDLAMRAAMVTFRLKGSEMPAWVRLRNDVAISLDLLHACILSEVEAAGRWAGGPRAALAVAWERLSTIADQPRRLHARRYKVILGHL